MSGKTNSNSRKRFKAGKSRPTPHNHYAGKHCHDPSICRLRSKENSVQFLSVSELKKL